MLVTGGCGQIGSHVVDELLSRDYKVIVLDPAPPLVEWIPYIEDDRLIYRHGTSADIHQITAILEEYGDKLLYIYDYGAYLGSEELTSRLDTAVQANTIGARNIFLLAKTLGVRVYHISIEFAGYGFTDGYSVTKEMALRMAIEYAKKYGVKIVTSYVHHVFCERQKLLPARKILPTLISYAVTGSRFRIFGSPYKLMDMLYAPDYAKVVVDLLEHPEVKYAHEHIYDIGVGYGIPIKELVEKVYRAVGREPNYIVMEDIRKQRPDPYRVATNDWKELLGDHYRLRGINEELDNVVKKYLAMYDYEDFKLAVAVYEQRHRYKEIGV